MQFSLPDEKGRYSQPNKSDSIGGIYMSYGIDLDEGRVAVSPQVKKIINNDDNVGFAGYAGSIGAYEGAGTDKVFAVSDTTFSGALDAPTSTWIEEVAGAEPDSGNTIMDSEFHDGLFLVSEATDIKSWNGTTWASWWQTALGQSALTTGDRHLMWTGFTGDLFIVDAGNKVYRKILNVGAPVTSGAGTVSFEDSRYTISCAISNSQRSFIGLTDNLLEEGAIAEWDESASASTVNRLHKVGAKGVRCLSVWNDLVIAILSNGKTKYFNGVSFVDFETPTEFPVTDGYELDDDFIHPNGWAIIDNLPHYLVSGRTDTNDTVESAKQGAYQMPSGVWCLDPSIGLYHRFALGSGLSSQDDYGQMQVTQVGALYALNRTDSKFLASYEYIAGAGTKSVLVYHDAASTKPSRGYLMTTFQYSLRDMWKKVELLHKKLATNEKIRVYFRTERNDVLAQSGTWSNTTTFHVTGTSLGISRGDVAFVKTGKGAGQLLRIASVEESSTVTVLTFEEANSFVSASDLGSLDIMNFKYMGEVTSTTEDYHTFTVPSQGRKRKSQFLFEFQQAANNTMELDFAIIT